MANTERVESRFYSRDGDSYVCGLCPHGCRLRPGQYGRCGSRRADEDMLVAYSYGKVSSIAVDPIEKKPLYHYRPRSRCFSVGSVGCNMRCRHCQNYSISMMSYGKKRTTYESPEELVAMCRHEGLDTIAFTYNEPGIWFEYIMDVMRADPDLHLVLVTNGFLNEEPLRQLCGVADAINLDVKGFTEDFYGKICEGRLADVMRSARIIRDEGVHLEITYLVIPGHNDSEDEVGSFCGWVRDELGADVPVHFTRFHPDFEMMDVPRTPQNRCDGESRRQREDERYHRRDAYVGDSRRLQSVQHIPLVETAATLDGSLLPETLGRPHVRVPGLLNWH